MTSKYSFVFGAMCACLIPGSSGWTQEPSHPAFAGNKIIPQVKEVLADIQDKQMIANVYEVPAGSMVPRHTHYGAEFHFVLAGEWAAEVEDRETRSLEAGDSQFVPPGKWHGGKVVGDQPLRLLGVMVIDTDKQVTTMVPSN